MAIGPSFRHLSGDNNTELEHLFVWADHPECSLQIQSGVRFWFGWGERKNGEDSVQN